MGFSFQLQSRLTCGPPNWHLLISLVYLERTVQGGKSCQAFWKQKAQRCSFPFDTEQLPAGYHGKKEVRSLFTLGKASWWGGHYRNWAVLSCCLVWALISVMLSPLCFTLHWMLWISDGNAGCGKRAWRRQAPKESVLIDACLWWAFCSWTCKWVDTVVCAVGQVWIVYSTNFSFQNHFLII